MTNRCPTCGQTMPKSAEPRGVDWLVEKLRTPIPYGRYGERQVTIYADHNRRFYFTYIGGEIHPRDVDDALAAGIIRLEYPEAPEVKAWELAPRIRSVPIKTSGA